MSTNVERSLRIAELATTIQTTRDSKVALAAVREMREEARKLRQEGEEKRRSELERFYAEYRTMSEALYHIETTCRSALNGSAQARRRDNLLRRIQEINSICKGVREK